MEQKIQWFITSRKDNLAKRDQTSSKPNLPNPFIVITDSDVEEANDTNMSVAIDPDDDDDR